MDADHAQDQVPLLSLEAGKPRMPHLTTKKATLSNVKAALLVIALAYPAMLVSKSIWRCDNPHPLNYFFDLFFPTGYLSFKIVLEIGVTCSFFYIVIAGISRFERCDARHPFVVALECVAKALVMIAWLPAAAFYAVSLTNKAATLMNTLQSHLRRSRAFFFHFTLSRGSTPYDEGNNEQLRSVELFPHGIFFILTISTFAIPFIMIPVAIGLISGNPDLSYTLTVHGSFILGGSGLAAIVVLCSILWNPKRYPLYYPIPVPAYHYVSIFLHGFLAIFGLLCLVSVLFGALYPMYYSIPDPSSTSDTNLRFMQFNIRYPAPSDTGNKSWNARKADFVSFVESMHPDVLTVQEAYIWPLWYIQNHLYNGGYGFTGKGRNDGVHGGEHSAIFYNKSRLSLEDGNTFWLSTSPLIPNMNNFRDCTWARFKDKQTGLQFLVFDTHYGWGDNFDENAANLILNEASKHNGLLPVILAGDFNSYSADPGYTTLTTSPLVRLSDAMYACNGTCNATNCTQPENWSSTPLCEPGVDERIDFIFTSDTVKVISYSSPRSVRPDVNLTYSDHYPVIIDVVIPPYLAPL